MAKTTSVISDHDLKKYLPQEPELHDWLSVVSPEQSPVTVHVLVLEYVPEPHDAEQLLQEPQVFHVPAAELNCNYMKRDYNFLNYKAYFWAFIMNLYSF